MKSRGRQCNETLLVRTAVRPGKSGSGKYRGEKSGVENVAPECTGEKHLCVFADSAFSVLYALMSCKTLCRTWRKYRRWSRSFLRHVPWRISKKRLCPLSITFVSLVSISSYFLFLLHWPSVTHDYLALQNAKYVIIGVRVRVHLRHRTVDSWR